MRTVRLSNEVLGGRQGGRVRGTLQIGTNLEEVPIVNGEGYSPVLVGMDYDFVESHGLYRQLLSRSVQRAQAVGAARVYFGMGSELEKTRFGARPESRIMLVQAYDRYHNDVLSLIAAEAKAGSED